MIFAPLALDDALGAILAHTHHLGASTLRKGTRLTAAELDLLRAAGRAEVVAAVLGPDDLDEDQAAARVAAAVTGSGLDASRARTGRSNLHAVARGVLEVDVAGVDALNAVDPGVTLATRPPWSRVEAGEMAATVKIIPYAVPRAVVDAAARGPLLRVHPFVPQRVALVVSRSPGAPTRNLEASVAAQRQRVRAVGGEVVAERWTEHDVEPVAAALGGTDVDLVLFVGASAIVDLDDVLPAAIRRAGGRVEHLGMPVDPGNLTLLGELGGAVVIGVPGCARGPKRSGFDQLLERVAARVPTAGADVQRMGVGGLLHDDPERPHPRSAALRAPRFGGVVLAAGRSSRMGPENKLLVELDGRPLVTRAVDALLDAGVRPLVVVTGHAHDAIATALGPRPVVLARNSAPEQGMASSLAAGLRALDPAVDGFFVMLGDVPFVRAEDVRALAAAFDPASAPICVPEHQRRRGHPVLWANRFRDELCGLAGDVGARAVLDAHADEVRLVPVDNPGISVDVDTPDALAAARAALKETS